MSVWRKIFEGSVGLALVAPPVWRVCFHDVSLTKHHSVCTRTHAVVGTQPATLAAAGSSQTSARKLVRNNHIQMNWLIINLKDIPTGRKLMTWSWTNAVQIQKKKRSKKRMSWNGKNETSRKSLVSWKLSIIQRLVDWERRKLDTYSCKYINFGRSKTQAFLQKHGKFTFWVLTNSLVSHRVVSISYSRLFFVRWLNSRGVSYPGGTALWSWWSSLFQKAEVVRRCCTWSWTCLASCLGCFWRHLCSEMDKIESRVLLFSSFPWFWACHQHDE